MKALLLVFLCACRTQPLQPLPMASPAAASCGEQPVALDRLQVDDLNQCPFDLVRVTFYVTLFECQGYTYPARVRYDAFSNTFTLTALGCRHESCAGTRQVEDTVILSDTAQPQPGNLTVLDGAPGSSTSLVIPIQQPVAPGECGTVTQESCVSNSQCEAADPDARCWYDGSRCVHSCHVDSDCSDGTHCDLGLCI
jgi:hypothetical protein